jgi:hypothetical protein
MPVSSPAEYSAWQAAGSPPDGLGGLELFLNLQKVIFVLKRCRTF